MHVNLYIRKHSYFAGTNMNKIVFDIETSGVDWEDLDGEQQKYLLKFTKDEDEVEQVKQRLALSALTAEIVCIGMLNPDTGKGAVYYRDNDEIEEKEFFEENIFYIAGSEAEILEKFWASMRHYHQFITFNGRSFDCPFLSVSYTHLTLPTTPYV